MIRILFCGVGYGAGNIGDDSILNGLIRASQSYMPEDTQYGAICWDPNFIRQRTGIKVWGREDPSAFDWATHCVLGGATLISERPSIKYPLQYCLSILRKGKKSCMLAVGTSDVISDEAKRLVKEYNYYLGVITLRSEKDKRRAAELGISEEKMHVCADAAFADHIVAPYAPTELIGLSLVNEGFNAGKLFSVNISKALNGLPVKGLCSETRKDPGFDYPILQQVVGRELHGNVLCEYMTPYSFAKELAECKLVITMRMHIMVFCAIIGVPCIPLIREEKMNLMADELGMKKRFSLNSSAEEIRYVVEHFDPQELIVDRSTIENLRVRAMKNGEILANWVGGK